MSTNVIQVSQNNVYFTGDSANASWQPTDSSQTVTNNDYGTITNVTYNDSTGEVVFQTDKGTLTFSAGPYLEEARQEFTAYQLGTTGFEEFDGVNWLEIASLVMEAEKLRRKTNREVRLSARDTALAEAKNAADTLRKAATEARNMGYVSAGISMLGGLVGVAGGAGGLRKIAKAAKVKTSQVKLEADLASNTKALAKNRRQLKALKDNPAMDRTSLDKKRINELEAEQTQLVKKQTQLQSKLDARIENVQAKEMETERKLQDSLDAKETAVNKRSANRERQAELEGKESLSNAEKRELKDLKKAESKLDKSIDAHDKKIDQHTADSRQAAADYNELNGLKSKSRRLQKGESDADVAEANSWSTDSNTRYGQAAARMQEVQTQVQAWMPVLNGLQGALGAGAGIANSAGQAAQTEGQANAQEQEAQVAVANHANEDANADMQDAKRAIDSFLDAWAKFIDSVKATQDRLVQA